MNELNQELLVLFAEALSKANPDGFTEDQTLSCGFDFWNVAAEFGLSENEIIDIIDNSDLFTNYVAAAKARILLGLHE